MEVPLLPTTCSQMSLTEIPQAFPLQETQQEAQQVPPAAPHQTLPAASTAGRRKGLTQGPGHKINGHVC